MQTNRIFQLKFTHQECIKSSNKAFSTIQQAYLQSFSHQYPRQVSLLVPALYFVFGQCRQHPTGLIAKISLLQAISNYNVVLIATNIYRFESFVNINAVFDFLTFNQPSEPSETDFCEVNFIVYICVELISIAYNFCFSLDLLLTLNYPFFAGKKRMKYYNSLSIIFVAILIPLSWQQTEQICQKQFHQRSIYKVPVVFVIMLGTLLIMSTGIIIFSYVQQSKLDQIRAKYVRHHRLILYILILVWLFPVLENVMIMVGLQETIYFEIANYASFFFLIVSGGLVNVVRFIVDPVLWKNIKNMIRFKLFDLSSRKNQTSKEVCDLWNLPLANAVAKFHNQKVVQNIVQIVQEICRDENRHQFLMNDRTLQMAHHMEQDEIQDILNGGSIRELEKLVKMNKNIKICCVHDEKSSFARSTFKSFHRQGKQGIIIIAESFADPIFSQIRKNNGLGQESLESSLNVIKNFKNIKNARESLGASGSFFFFSHDHSLVIKTIPENQKDSLMRLLPHYYRHLRKYPNSLLSKIYGLFSIQIAGISKIQLIMMENTFQTLEEEQITYKVYDLKGSTVSRQVFGQRGGVLKDINYYKSPDCFFFLTEERKQKLLNQVKNDITLLKGKNLMDYSLLVGVGIGTEESEQKGWRFMKDSAGMTNRVYSIALIDFLQEFNMAKYGELMLKKLFKGGGDISSVDTQSYYQRFLSFVSKIIITVKISEIKKLKRFK